jgi:hypothetical protein
MWPTADPISYLVLTHIQAGETVDPPLTNDELTAALGGWE